MKTRIRNNQQSNSFLSNYRSNLEQINRFNYRLNFHNYFRLTTKKITLMAMILAFNLVLTIFSRYVLGLVPIAGFFVVEISFASILIFTLVNNFFYTLFFLEITIWFRLALGSEPIGLLAMNLVDGFFLIGFCLIIFIFKQLVFQHNFKNWLKRFLIYQMLTVFMVSIVTSSVAVLINYGFILQLYFPEWSKSQVLKLLPIIFGLNLVKYLINGFFYFLTFKPILILIKHYKV